MIDRPTGNTITEAAFLMGDPARANMLAALMGGEALTAGELAAHASVTAQTASGHLARLTEGGLVAVERQGRHRYVRLASPAVAQALEDLMTVSGQTAGKPQRQRGPRDEAIRLARSCYDHLAGRLGVAVADAMQRRDLVRLEDGVGLVTDEGQRFLAGFGIDVAGLSRGKRPLCRSCLDWSERRPHLAGKLGAAMLDRSVEISWLVRTPKSRTLRISRAGERGFDDTFRCEPVWSAASAPRQNVIEHMTALRQHLNLIPVCYGQSSQLRIMKLAALRAFAADEITRAQRRGDIGQVRRQRPCRNQTGRSEDRDRFRSCLCVLSAASVANRIPW